MTLDILLSRTGNGTEYPAFLDIRVSAEKNITWAYTAAGSREAVDKVIEKQNARRVYDLPIFSAVTRMLAIPTPEGLEKERKCRQEEADRGEVCFLSGAGGIPMGNAVARKVFWSDDGPQDQYAFQISFPM